MALIGIGTDLVDLDRLRWCWPAPRGWSGRLFTAGEQAYAGERRDPTERFGGRFAAKEATMKALGVGLGAVAFRDIEVVRAPSGAPVLELHGTAASLAESRGVVGWLVTLSHTQHLAQAVVVALGPGASTP